VGLAAAIARDRLALAGLARLACRAVVRVAALLALVGDAELLGVAILVRLARRVVGWAAGRGEQGSDSDGEKRNRACSVPGPRRVQVDRMLGHWGTPSSGKTVRSSASVVKHALLGKPSGGLRSFQAGPWWIAWVSRGLCLRGPIAGGSEPSQGSESCDISRGSRPAGSSA